MFVCGSRADTSRTHLHTHTLSLSLSLSLQLDEKLSDFEFPDDFVLDVYAMVNAG